MQTAYRSLQHAIYAICLRRPRATSESCAGKVQGNASAVATGRGDGAAMQHTTPTLHECFVNMAQTTWRDRKRCAASDGFPAPLHMVPVAYAASHAGVASHLLAGTGAACVHPRAERRKSCGCAAARAGLLRRRGRLGLRQLRRLISRGASGPQLLVCFLFSSSSSLKVLLEALCTGGSVPG